MTISPRFEVSYCKAENSTYLITGVRQWMELAPQTRANYYWMSVTYGYFDGDEVQPTDSQNVRELGCRPLSYGQSESWSPSEEWRVTISANSGDTLGSKISNSPNCANPIRPIRLGGEEYPGAALLEAY